MAAIMALYNNNSTFKGINSCQVSIYITWVWKCILIFCQRTVPRWDSNRRPSSQQSGDVSSKTNRINPTKFIIFVCTGRHEFHFLKSLQSHYSSICSVAVDPNEGMLHTFKGRVATLNFDDKSSCHWFTGPLSQFVAEKPLGGKQVQPHQLYTFALLHWWLRDELHPN